MHHLTNLIQCILRPVCLPFIALSPLALAAAVDLNPPYFTRLVVTPSVVDVTSEPAIVEVEIDIQDDVSGLSSGGVLIDFEDILLKWFFSTDQLVAGLPTNGTYRVEVTIPVGAPAGNWLFGAQLFDGARRVSQSYLNAPSLQVINNGLVDAEPPTIHSIRFKDETLDISDGGGIVEIEFDISDDASGISHFRFDLIPEQDDVFVDTRLFVYYNVTEGTERKTIKATYPLGPYAPSGSWHIDLLALDDKVYRSNPYEYDQDLFNNHFDTKIEIINSNSDLEKPQLTGFAFENTSPDISFADARVPFYLDFSDIGSGIQSIQIGLYPPSGGRELTFYRKNPPINSGDVNGGTVEDYFEIPRFSEFGTYNLQIRLTDLAGNFILFGHQADNPLPSGIAPTLEVKNEGGVDQTDLEITGFRYSPNPVNVSNSDQQIDLFVDFKDDVSGLDYISLRIESPDEEFYRSARFDLEDLMDGDAFDGTVKAPITIPLFSEPGEWKITRITFSDAAGNYSSRSYPVFLDIYPNFLEVINDGPIDFDSPELVELRFESEVVDVTDGDQRLQGWLKASDDVSGVDNAWIRYNSPSNNHSYLFLSIDDYDIDSVMGDTVNFNNTMLVRQYVAPGDYLLESIDLEDKVGRERIYKDGGENPIPDGVPRKITVINDGPVDENPPEITGIRLSDTIFDITNFTRYAEVEIDFTDDVSGAYWLDIGLSSTEANFGVTAFDSRGFQIVSGTKKSGTLRASVTIPRFIPPGTYQVTYNLDDKLRRSEILRGGQSGFPFPEVGTLEVTNAGIFDKEDPSVTDLSIDASVDTSDGKAIAQVTLSIADDAAGIEYTYLDAVSPSGADRVSVRLDPEDLTEGTATEGTFVFPMEFPAFSEPGIWKLDVLMRDKLGNFFSPESEELIAIGLPGTITVLNDKPAGYLWKGSEAYPDGWRFVNWFGWAQDADSYPYVLHAEHGWVYTSGSKLSAFSMYDFATGFWWSVNEEWYPYMYANTSPPRWLYYYAPYGTPGNRWFYDFLDGTDKQEGDL